MAKGPMADRPIWSTPTELSGSSVAQTTSEGETTIGHFVEVFIGAQACRVLASGDGTAVTTSTGVYCAGGSRLRWVVSQDDHRISVLSSDGSSAFTAQVMVRT